MDRKKKKEEVSNKVLLVGVVILLLVSLLGTILVLVAVSSLEGQVVDEGATQTTGEVSLTVVDSNSETETTAQEAGTIELEVVEPE